MEFKKLDLDSAKVRTIPGTWVHALNILIAQGFTSVQNEEGFAIDIKTVNGVTQQSLEQAIIGILKCNDEFVIFSTNYIGVDNPPVCEIGRCKNGDYVTIIKDYRLGFKLWNPIEAVFHKNFKGELIVAWCDGVNDDSNTPRICNLDVLPFALNPDFSLVNPNEINLLNIFPDFTIPYVDTVDIITGGNLKSGSYYLSFAYELENEDRLSFIRLENPIPIIEDNYTSDFIKVDGCEAKTPTNKAIQIVVNNIDVAYNYLVIGVIASYNEEKSGYIAKKVPITNNTMTIIIDSVENAETIDYREILIPKAVYTGAKSITTVNKELHIANLRKSDPYSYQKYANNIKIEWLRDTSVLLDENAVGSFKDGSIVFNLRGFPSDEVFAFYIGLWFDNGELSPLYHIPGRRAYDNLTAGVANNDPTAIGERQILDATASSPEEDYLIGATVRYFQTRNTARMTYDPDFTHGEMGFWENEDETYPNTGEKGEENTLVFDASETQKDAITGERVRHHRFPDFSFLNSYNQFIAEYDSSAIEQTSLTVDNTSDNTDDTGAGSTWHKRGYFDLSVSATSTNVTISDDVVTPIGTYTPASVTINNRIITFNIACKISINYRIKANVTAGQNASLQYPNGGFCHLYGSLLLYNSSNVLIQTIEGLITDTDTGVGTGNITLAIDSGFKTTSLININAGDYLVYSEYFDITHDTADLSFALTTNATDSVLNIVDVATNYDIALKTKPIGIRLKDIYIPIELRDKVQAVEIFYAKRDANNSIIIDKALLFDYDWHNGTFDVTKGRLQPFTMLHNQLQTTPTYFKKYHEIQDNILPQDLDGDIVFDFWALALNNVAFLNDFRLRSLSNQKYLPYDNSATTPTNTGREFAYYAEMNTLSSGGGQRAFAWGALCFYRRNCYFDFKNQTPVSTGKLIIINKTLTTVQPDVDVYGGDTFTNLLATTLRYPGNARWASFYYPTESVANTALRHELKDGTFKYFPRTKNPDIYSSPVDITLNQYDYYNNDYTLLNDLASYIIWGLRDEIGDFTNLFPYRDARSLVDETETTNLKWRTFLLSSYYEMPRDKGVIWKVQGLNKTLYINMEFTTYIAQIKDKLLTNISEIYLGSSDLFDRLPDDLMPIPEGYIGCRSQFAAFVCKLGYVVIDRVQGKVFLLTDTPKEISNDGIREWLLLRAETDSITTECDNPYTQIGWTAGFDEKWNRLLISKQDYTPTEATLDLIEQDAVVFENNFYKQEIVLDTNFPILGVAIPNALRYLVKVTINGIDYVPLAPIPTNDSTALYLFLGTIPRYYILFNPDAFTLPPLFGMTNAAWIFRIINALPSDTLSIVVSTDSLGVSTTVYTGTSFGSYQAYSQTIVLSVAPTDIIGSLDFSSTGHGWLPINETAANFANIKAKLDRIYKQGDAIVTYDGVSNLTIKIPFTPTNVIYTLAYKDLSGSGITVISDTPATTSYSYYKILYYQDTTYFTPKSFTLSYHSVLNAWISFHSYYPNYLFNNVKGLYSIRNIFDTLTEKLTGTVYKHNIKTSFGTYYEGQIFDSHIDIIFNEQPTISKVFENVSWISEVRDPQTNEVLYRKTATHAMFYNTHQCSGRVTIISNPAAWYADNARRLNGQWNFDQFSDAVVNKELPFLNDDGSVIVSNISANKAWYDKNYFIEKFGILRIIYDNSEQLRFTLHDVAVTATIAED